MTKKVSYGVLISLFVIIGVLIAGCLDQSPADTTSVPTTAVNAKYVAGDIIGKTAPATENMEYIIINYDRSTDQYTRQMLYKNTDGSWGHFINNNTEKVERTLVEKVYPVKISHMNISSIPIIAPTAPPKGTTALSGNAPSISGISPATGGSNTSLSAAISGDNFRSGATVKLMRTGYSPIYATGVFVSSATNIACMFNLAKAEKGTYNLIVTNPDGQSDTMAGIFTVTDPIPIISGVSPGKGAINDVLSLTINGKNFKEAVKVTFIKGSKEIVCTSPVSSDSTKVLCNLDLKISNGAEAGDWDITLLNIDGQQKGTWNQKFVVTNST